MPPEVSALRDKVAVWRSFMEVHAKVLAELDHELTRGHQLTVSEFDTLINLPRGGVPMRELRERVILSQSALSRLVDRLERRGYVERTRLDGDSRAVFVRLTHEGRKVAHAAARTNAAVVDRAFAERLSADELADMCGMLTKLNTEESP